MYSTLYIYMYNFYNAFIHSPYCCCFFPPEFVVIHNGIITNYKELKKYLVSTVLITSLSEPYPFQYFYFYYEKLKNREE